jgi:ribosomal protein L10
MALTLEEKKAVVAEVAEVAQGALSAVAAEYRGLTVEELTDLRIKARQDNVYLRVIKNTLARRALEDTDFACMSDRLTGPLILAFSREDPGAAARVTKDFAKEHAKFEVTMLSVGGELLEPSADPRPGDQHADVCHAGADHQVRPHAERGAGQACSDDGGNSRPEAASSINLFIFKDSDRSICYGRFTRRDSRHNLQYERDGGR